MRNPKIDSIIEGLSSVNEAVNAKLLDRFILYCKAANAKNIVTTEFANKTFIAGISDKRLKELASNFAKVNNLYFEYNLEDGSTEIIRLQHK